MGWPQFHLTAIATITICAGLAFCINDTTSLEEDILETSEDETWNVNIFPTLEGMNFAADDTDGKRLFRDIFKNYLPAERPVQGIIHKLRDTCRQQEAQESLLLRFWIRLYWKDYVLHWDPKDYGGRDAIHVPTYMLWIPDIVIYNNLHIVHHAKDEVLYVHVKHNGECVYLYPTIIESSCQIDIKYFPVDTQNCTIKWGSWSFHGFAVNLLKRKDQADLSYYEPNNEFALVEASVIRHNVHKNCLFFKLNLRDFP